MRFKARNKTLDLSKPVLMGVLNVTPDSFSDGGKFLHPDSAIQHAKQMVQEGASIIDIGGESSRPGAKEITAKEELRRVLPVVQGLKDADAVLSIDTCKADVAEQCLQNGAHVINDIYGLQDPKLRQVVARHEAAAIVMHMQGTPQTMQKSPTYGDVVAEVKEFLQRQTDQTKMDGIQSVAVDPGIGFGKSLEHNLELLNRLDEIVSLGFPICVGVSRKSFIGTLTGDLAEGRQEGTLAAVATCVLKGAKILRVHDVAACRKAVDVAWAIHHG